MKHAVQNSLASDLNNHGCIVGSGEFGGIARAFVAIPVTQP
jgi:hypothetical protein